MRSPDFRIRRVRLMQHGFEYHTFELLGYVGVRRIRKRFKSREEADGEKNRLEVAAANAAGAIKTVSTRLSQAQLAEAEAAFTRLGERSLSGVVDWYLVNYRPPIAGTALETATAAFLADRKAHVRPVVLADYKRTLADVAEALPKKQVHEIGTEDVQTFLDARKVGRKRFNNLRGELHTFFEFCLKPPRAWCRDNPVVPIPAFKIARGLPEIMTAAKAAEIMAYVETYTGAGRDHKPGCLVPYFAICLFAGIRPSAHKGEIGKLAASPNLSRAVDQDLGVIRLSPEISKVKSVRQVTIQPNLAAWLARYPLKDYPILPLGHRKMLDGIRARFQIGHDVMRHTFISMHVAKFKSMSAAALEAGNSESMIKRHYYNLVSNADAAAFWAIRPGVVLPRQSASRLA